MQRPPIGMSVRRGSLKLKTLGRAHGPLHMLLWQAREAQSTLLAAAAAQKTLFTDIAAWASSENRALSDVCSCASELSTLYSGALTQLALAFKSFRKEMSLVLEGEKRCDATQKRLQDAESKRIKLRRQVLKSQNRTINEGVRQSGDFTQLQSQLAESERTAERAHVEACDASREQEAVKLVVMRTALSKLSRSHLTHATQVTQIFEGNLELSNLLPEPPPPGDPLSCIRYTAYDTSKGIVDRVKRQVNIDSGSSVASSSRRRSSEGSSRPLSTSTPVTSPHSSMWSSEPSAPPTEPPPPYNTSYISSSPNQVTACSRNSSHNLQVSPQRSTSRHVRSSPAVNNCINMDNYSMDSSTSSLCSNSNAQHHFPPSYSNIDYDTSSRDENNHSYNNTSSSYYQNTCSNHYHTAHSRNNSTISVQHLFGENNLSTNPDPN